jgi:hypothetical protein
MNKWKVYAILLILLGIGNITVTTAILFSDVPGMSPNRSWLMMTSIIITSVVRFFAVRFWRKASLKRLN